MSGKPFRTRVTWFWDRSVGLSNPPLVLSNAQEPGAEKHDPKRSEAAGHHGGDTSRGIRECQKADGQRDPGDSGVDQAHTAHNSPTAHVFRVVTRPHAETSIPPCRKALPARFHPILVLEGVPRTATRPNTSIAPPRPAQSGRSRKTSKPRKAPPQRRAGRRGDDDGGERKSRPGLHLPSTTPHAWTPRTRP